MNILITRPLIDSEDLMGKLFSLGHKIVHIPTLKISEANARPVDGKNMMRLFLQVQMLSEFKADNQDTSRYVLCWFHYRKNCKAKRIL